MGNVQSLKLDELEGKIDVPSWTLTPFPSCWRGIPGKVVKMFKALPPKPNLQKAVSNASDDVVLWPDGQFIPYKDDELVTNHTAFLPRPGRTPLLASNLVEGLIAHWKLSERIGVSVLKHSKSRANPRVVPTPNGRSILFLGAGNLSLMDINTLVLRTKSRSGTVSSFDYCTMSPNGLFIASIARKSSMFELGVSLLSSDDLIISIDTAICHHICKGFVGTRRYTEEVECKWSPDSSCIAVAGSFGMLFVVTRKALKLKFCFQKDLELPVCTINNARSFDFDPRYRHSRLAVATTDNFLYTININKKSVIAEVAVESKDVKGTIHCVSYNKDGTLLAVATSEATVHMFNCDNATLLYKLEDHENAGPRSVGFYIDLYPTIVRMSFSCAGKHMATSSTDGMIRLWLLPTTLNLQQMCKITILQNVPINKVMQLPIPKQLALYLLNWPTAE